MGYKHLNYAHKELPALFSKSHKDHLYDPRMEARQFCDIAYNVPRIAEVWLLHPYSFIFWEYAVIGSGDELLHKTHIDRPLTKYVIYTLHIVLFILL